MRKTSEFDHYDGCRRKDVDNCSGCALTNLRQDAPNYAAWPLVYMENGRISPKIWKRAFLNELKSSNRPYAANLKRHIRDDGARFSDGTRAVVLGDDTVEIRGRFGTEVKP